MSDSGSDEDYVYEDNDTDEDLLPSVPHIQVEVCTTFQVEAFLSLFFAFGKDTSGNSQPIEQVREWSE